MGAAKNRVGDSCPGLCFKKGLNDLLIHTWLRDLSSLDTGVFVRPVLGGHIRVVLFGILVICDFGLDVCH